MPHQHLEPLPHAAIATVLGLLEHLREAPNGRVDLYKLGGPLGYELDDLLPVTEAAKRLGLASVSAGDIELTPEGRKVVAAEEPERKRLLAPRLVELCFQTAGIWQIKTQNLLALPMAFDSLVVYRQLDEAAGQRLYALVEASEDGQSFQAQVVDENGRVYVNLHGYRTVQLPGTVTL